MMSEEEIVILQLSESLFPFNRFNTVSVCYPRYKCSIGRYTHTKLRGGRADGRVLVDKEN